MPTKIKRVYDNFAGVDFLSESTLVSNSRSPDALNVYKDYDENLGSCIQTRPGVTEIANFTQKILGFFVYSADKAVIHSGTNLYLWSNFPTKPATTSILFDSMNVSKKSSYVLFSNNLYIVDGLNYLKFDGTVVSQVSKNSYIPTTTIARNPSGGGELLEDINVLQPKRINTFIGDGTSKDYFLDATNIDDVFEVKVNDTITTAYTVTKSSGKIAFTTAPSKPNIAGTANVEITFGKTISGYDNRIKNCTKMTLFDNRIFYTGNSQYPNAIFNCKLNTPNYISDLDYYQDGSSDSYITDFCVGNNVLWVFKKDDQNNANIFYHTSTIDSQQNRIVYPSKQGNVGLGCISKAHNFRDDIVYLSKRGLEGISDNLESGQAISHRSSLVDSKMINQNEYENAEIAEWKSYLLLLINNKVFLADTNQKFQNLNSFEYEWYYWDLSSISPILIKDYNGEIYFGTTDGKIYKLSGTNDNGIAITSYWITKADNFNYNNMYKTTNKRGGIAKFKTIPNSKIKVAIKTNKINNFKFITEKSLKGFSFINFSFIGFSFTTSSGNYLIYKIKEKKFNELSMKFYSDELNKPFGIYNSTLEVFIGGYVKR